MKARISDLESGHAVYTKRDRALYDRWVLGFLNSRVWQCPTSRLESFYREHMSPNHLDVGAGTGYFLEKCLPPLEEVESRVALLDINRDCLDTASARIADYRPELYQENVLESFEIPEGRFDSIAMNYLLHCLPGDPEEKATIVFDNLLPHLIEGGTLFGTTILGKEISRPMLASIMMSRYNKKGKMTNANDSLGAVMDALSSCFKTFNVEVCGCVVLFWGKGAKK